MRGFPLSTLPSIHPSIHPSIRIHPIRIKKFLPSCEMVKIFLEIKMLENTSSILLFLFHNFHFKSKISLLMIKKFQNILQIISQYNYESFCAKIGGIGLHISIGNQVLVYLFNQTLSHSCVKNYHDCVPILENFKKGGCTTSSFGKYMVYHLLICIMVMV
jgi:DNA-directed RNA polymerase beta' subunit